jgi:NAD(P)-dependent dehydrogenase (short-subunit alcohol dehydrogenase family)
MTDSFIQGIRVEEVAVNVETCAIDMADYKSKLALKPKVAAFNYAGNDVGTISDVKTMVDLAHEAGAYTVVDAVHYVAHGVTDMAFTVLDGPEGDDIRAQSPLNRVARPDEVTRVVLFPASPGTDYLTRCIIDVDGASYLRT